MVERILKSKTLEVKKSRNGLGVFAKKNFKIGGKLTEIRGPFITCEIDEEIDEETRSNAYRFDENLYISPKGTIPDKLNHSCKPNSRIVKKNNKLFIFSIDEIKKGDEIVFDYSTIIASDDIWQMKCNCGEENCRRVIKGFKSLPKSLKVVYISSAIVPSYIVEI